MQGYLLGIKAAAAVTQTKSLDWPKEIGVDSNSLSEEKQILSRAR